MAAKGYDEQSLESKSISCYLLVKPKYSKFQLKAENELPKWLGTIRIKSD